MIYLETLEVGPACPLSLNPGIAVGEGPKPCLNGEGDKASVTLSPVVLLSLLSQAQVAFLQGERKGQENLKTDLVRRIKMLEYALKQER